MVQVNKYMFRGYDLRGKVDIDLNPEIMEHLGKAQGTYMKRKGIKKALVGYDSRAPSVEYSQAFIKGLRWCGMDVINIGLTLVGTYYWAQYYLKCPGGGYISASHNPPEYNGIKLAIDYSETMVSESIQELRKMVEEEDYDQGEKEGSYEEKDIHQVYYDDIVKRLPLKNKFKVLIDPGCSTAGAIAPKLFEQAGCEVICKNCQIDPDFPLGVADPTESEMMERISKEVLEAGADIGFAYDADGDRIGVVDEKGGIIWNDVLLALLSISVLQEHPGAKIMFNTLCSRVVTETIEKNRGIPFMWRTGHSFLKKKNQEVGAAFIGELSGHFFFSEDYYNHDDGLYTSLRLLKYLADSEQTLSQAIGALEQYISSPEIKLYCADDKKVALMTEIAKVLRQDFPEAEIIDDERAGDGVRLEMAEQMFVVRYSQNGPYITIKYEAKTQADYYKLRQYISKLLHGYKEIDWENEINVNTEALD